MNQKPANNTGKGVQLKTKKKKKKKTASFAEASPVGVKATFKLAGTPTNASGLGRRMPLACTPGAARDKRKAQTPLSARSEALSSPAASTPGGGADRSMYASPLPSDASMDAGMNSSLDAGSPLGLGARLRLSSSPAPSGASPAASSASPATPGGGCGRLNSPDTPLSAKGSGCAADSEHSGQKGRKQSEGVGRRLYGQGFYSPATFLRMRPYGGDRKYRGLTPANKGLASPGDGDAAECDPEWSAGSEEEESSEDWEADGDSAADEAALATKKAARKNRGSEGCSSLEAEDSEYGTDASAKSGQWCRSLAEKIEAAGLTPKGPDGQPRGRPAHLRYVASYAEESLDGESDAFSEYLPSEHTDEHAEDKSDSDSEGDSASEDESRDDTAGVTAAMASMEVAKGKEKSKSAGKAKPRKK